MNELQNFNFNDNNVRVLNIDGIVWFSGADVANALGYQLARKAIKQHVTNNNLKTLKWRDSSKTEQSTFWATNDYTNKQLINESGIYSLTMDSKLPQAQSFKSWVTDDVLPALRKNGTYSVQGAKKQDSYMIEDPIERAKAWIDEQKAKQEVENENRRLKPGAQFAQQVSDSKDTILIGQLAKYLKQNGVETGEKRLFNYLRDTNYLISRKGRNYNAPTQKSMNLSLMKNKERLIHTDNGDKIRNTPLITGKGQRYFLKKLIKDQKNNNDDSLDLF